ncbi:hypothetical protein F4803DRAFT_555532 [Xylaria telfairii]|nr:hypothetical protein F4803DRAFT_555532 [Xylaria telfairii]
MAPKTVQELRANSQQLLNNTTRYGLYSQNNDARDSEDGTPSLLLLLRNANNIPGGNRDRLINQLRRIIGDNCASLHLAGKDYFGGETRDLYANNRAEEFINQADAAILKAIDFNNDENDIVG